MDCARPPNKTGNKRDLTKGSVSPFSGSSFSKEEPQGDGGKRVPSGHNGEAVSDPQSSTEARAGHGQCPERRLRLRVFDFGGGTTDFDFGEWQTSIKPRYDFIITHYGAQGDRYLGGENLLALLAFEIFKKNAVRLRQEGITFMQPAECNGFQGNEMLIDNNSCEAAYNIKNLMKALRPIWEGTETEGEKNSLDNQESLEVNLLNAKGDLITGFRLDANRNEIMAILKSRIDMGVQQFFAAFHSAFYKRNDKEMRMDRI